MATPDGERTHCCKMRWTTNGPVAFCACLLLEIIRLPGRQPLFCLLNQLHQAQRLWRGRGSARPLDLGHRLLRKMRLQEAAHIKAFPPAVQNQPAGLAAGFLPAIAEGDFLTEARTACENILVVFVQHGQTIRLSTPVDEPCLCAQGGQPLNRIAPHFLQPAFVLVAWAITWPRS